MDGRETRLHLHQVNIFIIGRDPGNDQVETQTVAIRHISRSPGFASQRHLLIERVAEFPPKERKGKESLGKDTARKVTESVIPFHSP